MWMFWTVSMTYRIRSRLDSGTPLENIGRPARRAGNVDITDREAGLSFSHENGAEIVD